MGVHIYEVRRGTGEVGGYQLWCSTTGLPLMHTPTPTVTALESLLLTAEECGYDVRQLSPAKLQEKINDLTVAVSESLSTTTD